MGHPAGPPGAAGDKVKIDRNMTLGELNHSRSPLGWLIWLVLYRTAERQLQARSSRT